MKKFLNLVFMFILFFPIMVNALAKEDMQQISLAELGSVEKLSSYQGFQGLTITDKYIVVSLSKTDNSSAALIVLDKNTFETVKTIESLKYGHANDLAYNKKTNEVLVVDGTTIYVLDGDSFEEKEQKTLDTSSSAIDFTDSGYYTLAGKTIRYYDSELNFENSFDVETNLITQGIKYYNGHIFLTCYENGTTNEYESVYDGILEAGANVIYIYNLDGSLENVYYIPAGYGEIEAIDFQDGKYFLLFNNPGATQAVFYTLDTEDFKIDLTIEANDSSLESNLSASVYSLNDELISTSNLKDSLYTFSLTFSDAGVYQYEIKQTTNARTLAYDSESIPIDVAVDYDILTNSLDGSLGFTSDKQEFANDEIRANVACEVIDGIFYGPDGEELTEEEFMDICKVVENPQTGAFIPFTFLSILGILAIVIILNRKRILYRV